MTEEEAKCIVVSVWEAKSCLSTEYNVNLNFRIPDGDSTTGCVEIEISKNYRTVFNHEWQVGDTLESFLDGFNARFTSIFGLNE